MKSNTASVVSKSVKERSWGAQGSGCREKKARGSCLMASLRRSPPPHPRSVTSPVNFHLVTYAPVSWSCRSNISVFASHLAFEKAEVVHERPEQQDKPGPYSDSALHGIAAAQGSFVKQRSWLGSPACSSGSTLHQGKRIAPPYHQG